MIDCRSEWNAMSYIDELIFLPYAPCVYIGLLLLSTWLAAAADIYTEKGVLLRFPQTRAAFHFLVERSGEKREKNTTHRLICYTP